MIKVESMIQNITPINPHTPVTANAIQLTVYVVAYILSQCLIRTQSTPTDGSLGPRIHQFFIKVSGKNTPETYFIYKNNKINVLSPRALGQNWEIQCLEPNSR